MRKFLANVLILAGALLAGLGLALTPLVKDHLPASWFVPTYKLGSGDYFVAINHAAQQHEYMPYLAALAGALALVSGIVLRRWVRKHEA